MERIPDTIFSVTRLNASTFAVQEDDLLTEYPIIYIKTISNPPLLLVCDAGCGGYGRQAQVTSLREFIETVPIPANSNAPLNPGGMLPYLIVCTHCHYDHVLGIPDFLGRSSDVTILASSNRPEFITTNFASNSACEFRGYTVPKYTVSYWAGDHEIIAYKNQPLDIKVLHTPGHTPDSLCLYDISERYIFAGDTVYRSGGRADASIFISKEGDWIDYFTSVERMLKFIQEQNAVGRGKLPKLKVACGHITYGEDAEILFSDAYAFACNILRRNAKVAVSEVFREEPHEAWFDSRDTQLSLVAPIRLTETARTWFQIVDRN